MTLLLYTAGDPQALAGPLREVVREMDAGLPIIDLRTMSALYEERAVTIIRIIIEAVGSMGLMGVTLAFVGLYGLVAYAVSSRTREIGVRMAIGATRADVLRMVLRKGMTLAGIGLVIGLVLTFGADRALQAAFPGGSGGERGIFEYALATAALLAITALASYLPARRASRIQPTQALRYE
jgi:ABC-type antimicrobial peptide transport system permease subunit